MSVSPRPSLPTRPLPDGVRLRPTGRIVSHTNPCTPGPAALSAPPPDVDIGVIATDEAGMLPAGRSVKRKRPPTDVAASSLADENTAAARNATGKETKRLRRQVENRLRPVKSGRPQYPDPMPQARRGSLSEEYFVMLELVAARARAPHTPEVVKEQLGRACSKNSKWQNVDAVLELVFSHEARPVDLEVACEEDGKEDRLLWALTGGFPAIWAPASRRRPRTAFGFSDLYEMLKARAAPATAIYAESSANDGRTPRSISAQRFRQIFLDGQPVEAPVDLLPAPNTSSTTFRPAALGNVDLIARIRRIERQRHRATGPNEPAHVAPGSRRPHEFFVASTGNSITPFYVQAGGPCVWLMVLVGAALQHWIPGDKNAAADAQLHFGPLGVRYANCIVNWLTGEGELLCLPPGTVRMVWTPVETRTLAVGGFFYTAGTFADSIDAIRRDLFQLHWTDDSVSSDQWTHLIAIAENIDLQDRSGTDPLFTDQEKDRLFPAVGRLLSDLGLIPPTYTRGGSVGKHEGPARPPSPHGREPAGDGEDARAVGLQQKFLESLCRWYIARQARLR